VDRVRNDEIPEKTDTARTIMYIKTGQLIWFGHVKRMNNDTWVKTVGLDTAGKTETGQTET
jgi:hypothetical protein